MKPRLLLVFLLFLSAFAEAQYRWAWVEGLRTGPQSPIYNFFGSYRPGSRANLATYWSDKSNNLYFFGREGRGSSSNVYGESNELLVYNTSTNKALYISGALDQTGIYGTRGVASTSNRPGARTFSSTA